MYFEAVSSESALVANGKAKHVLSPWRIAIDTDDETITVTKRNVYLIGEDEEVLAFKYIRKIQVDEHLIGADIHIKVVGGKISAYCLTKNDAREIKDILMDYNRTKKGNHIIFN